MVLGPGSKEGLPLMEGGGGGGSRTGRRGEQGSPSGSSVFVGNARP